MKNLLLFLFVICQFFAIGQTETFNSSSTSTQESTFKTKSIARKVIITANMVTVTNLWNAGKDDAKLKIDKVVDKEYFIQGMCKWYYCTSTVKDVTNGYEKVIVIVSENQEQIDVFDFADEVTVYHSRLYIDR